MKNGILTLSWGDLTKGLIVAIGVFVGLYVEQTYHLLGNLSPEIKGSLVSLVIYMAKNFFTTDSGKVAGVIPTE